MNRRHLAGILILAGILAAVAWRAIVATAVLGDFDPADMPHRDRAFLSIGNVGGAVLFVAALWLIAGILRRSRHERIARLGAIAGSVGAVAATAGTVGLVWWHGWILGLDLYVVAMGIAWASTGYAVSASFSGGLRWAALVTAVVYGLAAFAVFAGAFIIFIMTVATAPLDLALVLSKGARPGEAGELVGAVANA